LPSGYGTIQEYKEARQLVLHEFVEQSKAIIKITSSSISYSLSRGHNTDP